MASLRSPTSQHPGDCGKWPARMDADETGYPRAPSFAPSWRVASGIARWSDHRRGPSDWPDSWRDRLSGANLHHNGGGTPGRRGGRSDRYSDGALGCTPESFQGPSLCCGRGHVASQHHLASVARGSGPQCERGPGGTFWCHFPGVAEAAVDSSGGDCNLFGGFAGGCGRP